MLLLHIICAITSTVLSCAAVLMPRRALLQTVYVLEAVTVLSGAYVAAQTHAALQSVCISGLVYLAIITCLTFVSRWRLRKEY